MRVCGKSALLAKDKFTAAGGASCGEISIGGMTEGRTSRCQAQNDCSTELQTMTHLFTRDRVEFSFRTLVDRTIHEQRREERRLAEQRATKHQFQARNSCIFDGRNYRIARRLLLLARAQF
jgi:hypothetical protein